MRTASLGGVAPGREEVALFPSGAYVENEMLRRLVRFLALLSCAAATAFPLLSLAAPAAAQGQTRLVPAPTGNEARYRVREQFVGVNLPNDAVGATSAITGAIVLDPGGRVVADASKFLVDIRTLKSDSENRDRVIQGRVLETDEFPHVELAIKDLRGLTYPLPASGELKLQLVADMTVHGVTKPWTWDVTVSPKGTGVTGRATTSFTFGDFGMPVPTSFRLLSVEDRVRLEYDFHLIPG
jgi:polyisoprenoid-binding protein YceI